MIILSLVQVLVKFAVVILLLLSVITIFVSPAVDLQPTVLRALKLANVLFAVLVLAGNALFARLNVPLGPITTIVECRCGLWPPSDLFELNCTRRC